MFVAKDGTFYGGDCQPGDRAATAEEMEAYAQAKSKAARKAEIIAELFEIDKASARPARELVAALIGGASAITDIAKEKIRVYNARADELRSELSGLG